MEEERFIMNKKYFLFGGVQLFLVFAIVSLFVSYEKKASEVDVLNQANSILFNITNEGYEELDIFKKEQTEQISGIEEKKNTLEEKVKNLEEEINSLNEKKSSWEKKISEVEK